MMQGSVEIYVSNFRDIKVNFFIFLHIVAAEGYVRISKMFVSYRNGAPMEYKLL